MDDRARRIDELRAEIKLKRAQICQLEAELKLLGYDPTLQRSVESRRRALERYRHEWERINGPSYRRRLSCEDEIDGNAAV